MIAYTMRIDPGTMALDWSSRAEHTGGEISHFFYGDCLGGDVDSQTSQPGKISAMELCAMAEKQNISLRPMLPRPLAAKLVMILAPTSKTLL